MTKWDDRVDPARIALEKLIAEGDAMADRLAEAVQILEIIADANNWTETTLEHGNVYPVWGLYKEEGVLTPAGLAREFLDKLTGEQHGNDTRSES